MGFRQRLNEAIKAFKTKNVEPLSNKEIKKEHGETFTDLTTAGLFGAQGVSSFNLFFNKYINDSFNNKIDRINNYRAMAKNPEIADVIEDAVNESSIVNDDGFVCWLEIIDDDLSKNQNVVDSLYNEFEKVFYKRLEINRLVDDLLHTYYVDSQVFAELIIDQNKPSEGIRNIKRIPTETMDFVYDPRMGKILFFMQYIKNLDKKPMTFQEAEEHDDVIALYPDQIMYFDYGLYQDNIKTDVFGYLEKVKQPYNQLKLLETSSIIYRIVRAPERFVFKIDVGNMPRDKAMKYVEKVKQGMQKKINYDPESGQMVNAPEILSILENFFIPTSPDGRGSDIDSIGGNSSGFAELDDIYYFARKLYRALKYPQSRVTAQQEKSEGDSLFASTSYGEIARDEVKWGMFLLKHQQKLADALKHAFLTHLKLVGLKKEHNIDERSIGVKMNVPNDIIERIKHVKKEQMVNDYQNLVNNEEFSKYYLMKRVLHMTDEEIKENANGKKRDKELGFKEENDNGF